MSGRVSHLLAVAGAALAVPATASAATFTVDPGAAAGCAGNVCKTLADANAAVADGDTISITASKTPYTEAAIVVTKKNVTIEGQPGGAIITSSAAAGTPVIRIGNGTAPAGEGTTIKNLFVSGQENGGAAIRVSAKGATIEAAFVARATKNTTDAAALLVDDFAGGTTTVKSSFVVNTPTATAAQSAPALQGGAASSLVLQDTLVLSGATQGPAIALTGNDRTGADDTKPIANQIIRSTAYANATNQDALLVTSGIDSTVNKLVTVDSSIFSGGQNGGGLNVVTEGDQILPTSSAGDVAVTLNHVTIAGSTEGIVVDASTATGPGIPTADPAGNVDIKVDRSIVKGSITGEAAAGALVYSGNTVKIDVKNSDAVATASSTGGTTITASGNQNSAPDALFADPGKENFHLKVGSPAIDRGGAQVAGESDKDIDGEARVGGAASDLGADEFFNKAPTPVASTPKADVAVGEAVTFDGSKSTDPEAAYGGGIKTYAWDFGDGSERVTTNLPTVQHAYAAAGTYTARLAVVDAQDAPSTTVASVVVNVGGAAAGSDGTPPAVTIASPKANATLKLYTVKTTTKKAKKKGAKPVKKTTKKIRRITFSGSAQDASGIGGVQIAIRRVKLAPKPRKKTTTKKKASSSQSGSCTFFDIATNAFKVLNCKKPRYTNIAVKDDGSWAYKLKSSAYPKLKAGTYELFVRATDKSGTVSEPVKVTFTVKAS